MGMGSKKSKPKSNSKYGENRMDPSGSQTGENEVKEFDRVHADRVNCLAVYKPGVCLSGGTDMNLAIFDYQAGKLRTKWKSHEKDLTKISCGSYQRKPLAFSASRDKTIKLWLVNDSYTIQQKSVYKGHDLVVTAVDHNSDCTMLCSGSRDNCIKLWDIETDKCIRTTSVPRNLITCVKWFPSENLIAQTGEDKMLRLWDSRSLEVTFAFPPKQYFGTCCDISEDGRFILTSLNGFNGSGCEIILWDVRGKKQIYSYHGHEQTVSSCSFLPRLIDITSWPLIISASHDCTVKVWNQETQKCLATENFFGSGPLTDLIVWSDGRFCVSSFDNGIHQLCLTSDGEGGVNVKYNAHF